MQDITRYSIVDTETQIIRSTHVNQDSQISIALPVFHSRKPDQKCPVIYVLDANFFFGIITEMTRLMAQCSELTDTVVVGIGYPWTGPAADAYDIVSGLRCRDLTPVVSIQAEEDVLRYSPALQKCESGGAAKFLRFLHEELIPIVESQYPIDPTDRTLLGHSWGGTFALFEMFHSTGFQKYVVCDADINYGEKYLFKYEKAFAETHDRLPVKAFLSNAGEDTMLSVLERRRYEGLVITSQNTRGLRHCEGAIPAFQAGIKSVFS